MILENKGYQLTSEQLFVDTPKIKLGPISFRTSAADMSDWPTWTPSIVPLDDGENFSR